MDYLQKFENSCRKHNLKITHQRLEIYRTLLQLNNHPSAEEIHKELIKNMPTVSLDTVYRTLTTFESIGLVKRVETLTSQARFEAKIELHHHFFCNNCEKLIDFSWDFFDLDKLPQELDKLGKIESKGVILRGICKQCLDKS